MAVLDAPTTPPHNLEAEQSVLGAVLLSDTALPALIIDERLQPEDFYRQAHGVIFRAMLDLHQVGENVDSVTLVEHLRQSGELEAAGGKAGVDVLAGAVPAVSHVRQYARIVRENAMLRRLLGSAYEIIERVLAHDAPPRELVDIAERTILEVAHDDRRKDFRPIEELLHAELDKLAELSKEGKSITGTASGFEDLDNITGGFQAGNLIILAARPSMGKCLPGSALVYDPMSGTRRSMDELVAAVERGDQAFVAALDGRHQLVPARATLSLRSGVKPVYRLVTKLGRRVEATGNHPLLTIQGWRPLDSLRTGDRIAVPRTLPQAAAPRAMPDQELVLLAALIADGNLTNRTPRFCFGADSPLIDEVDAACVKMGAQLKVPACGHGTAHISVGRWGGPNPVRVLCERHGVWNKRSEAKFVPEAIFALSEAQIARFLGVLYACDGHLYASDRLRQVGYTTISEALARGVQHLLLKLGIVAKIRRLPRPVYDGTGKAALEVVITGQESLGKFCRQVSVPGKERQAARILAALDDAPAATNTDTLPVEIWGQILEAKGTRSWGEISRASGRSPNHSWHVGRRGLSRRHLGGLARALESEPLRDLATSDLWWDEIVEIEFVGKRETYDISVPGYQNFVADDVIVHNSALMANFAENAALANGKAVALFSLEMSEGELAQRFIASQASIKGDDLRKGKVPESRWPKILQASTRLSNAPLFIDDSSDLSVLDVRAKARRLLQQHPDGLGLVLIDYLQLMRASGSSDNRTEQIGQISRGLKTLARELDVPVIALSQLNRGVEQRHDKRPVLSDLRESGSIEQDADLVMFIYRDEYYDPESEREGIADLIISKHRNGGLGTVELTFQKEFPRFMNYISEDRY